MSEFKDALNAVISSTGTLTTALAVFGGLVSKMEQRHEELTAMEESMKARRRILDELDQQLSRKQEKWQLRVAVIKEQLIELQSLKAVWNHTQEKMIKNASQVAEAITLNIGGKKFTTTKSVLMKHPTSYFCALLSSDHLQKLKGNYFIDRNPKYFKVLLEYLRGGTLAPLVESKLEAVRTEFEFYGIPFPSEAINPPEPSVKPIPASLFVCGGLISIFKEHIQAWLPNQHLVLLYKATHDGFRGIDNRQCVNRGPRLVVIQSTEGFTFGTYLRSHLRENDEILHHSAFLFTLFNPHQLPPTKYRRRTDPYNRSFPQNVISKFSDDIVVLPNSNLPTVKSYFEFPSAFVDTTDKGNLTFTGSRVFTAKEVEVYGVFPCYPAAYSSRGTQLLQGFTHPIESWLPNRNFVLLHHAARDGFTFAEIADTCSKKGEILIVAQSQTGYLFGGYTHSDFISSASLSHPSDFIYTLSNPHSIPPTQYQPNTSKSKHRKREDFFTHYLYIGCGVDMRTEIADRTLKTSFSFPSSFSDTTGKGSLTFTGTKSCVLKDFEMFSVVFAE